MTLNARDNQTNKKAPHVKEKASSQAAQGTKKFEKSEKSEKARKKKKEEPEKEARPTRRQHFGLGDKCNPSRKEQRSTKAGPQSDHLL